MDFSNRKNGLDLLRKWQSRRLIESRAKEVQATAGPENVTVLAYHFWHEDVFDVQFDYLECAIRETWLRCGMMKTVLVVNAVTPKLAAFAERFGDWVRIDVEASLVPGNLYTMSVDCNSKLHCRFDTDYVLIVQDDGFPLRSGLEDFLGKWDFIGSPNVRDKWYLNLVCDIFNCHVCNGGFSMRTKRIAEMAAYYWKKKYFVLGDCAGASEDYFCTKTLPLRERRFRRNVKLPSHHEALRFAYEAIFPYSSDVPPFGFHSPLTFKILYETGLVEQ